MSKFTNDQIKMTCSLYSSGKEIDEIVEITKISKERIYNILKKNGITLRGRGRRSHSLHIDRENLYKLYVINDLSAQEISEILACNVASVFNYLKYYKIKVNKRKYDLQQDLTNKKFGKLLIVGPNENDAGVRIWDYVCKCGNTGSAPAKSFLQAEHIKSCGCMRGKEAWKILPPCEYNRLKNAALRRGREFNLSREFLEKLLEKQNFLCNISKIPIAVKRRRDIEKNTASLDRIDSKLGYIEGNVQWVHKKINVMKLDLDQSYFIELCKIISEANQ